MSTVQKHHAYYCFEVLANFLEHHKEKAYYSDSDLEEDFPLEYSILNQIKQESYPLFVTWNLESDGEEELRGCIGNFSPMDLRSGLRQYALISALQDTRFEPITKYELDDLSCSVSLLTHFEKGDDYLDWEIGVHGIRIRLMHHHQSYSATYLPEIAQEQGWTKKQTILSLLRKAGFRFKPTDEILNKIVLTRYQSDKVKVSYKEYVEFRDKVPKN